VLIQSGAAVLTASQARAHVPCSACERRFDKGGEEWLIEKCWVVVQFEISGDAPDTRALEGGQVWSGNRTSTFIAPLLIRLPLRDSKVTAVPIRSF